MKKVAKISQNRNADKIIDESKRYFAKIKLKKTKNC